MEISQTKDIRLSRSALFRHLSAREDDSWTERTVYITSESLQGKSATPVLSGPAIEAVIKHVGTSDTGLVLFRREEEGEVVEPPVPVPMDAILEDQDLLLLEDIFDDELFDLRISDVKEMFSEAIIADITGDTMSAGYQFELLFESFTLTVIKFVPTVI